MNDTHDTTADTDQPAKPVSAAERRKINSAEKRRTSERRRQVDPTTCEREYNDDELEFMKAIELYKRQNRRPFPTLSEILEVLQSLGYRKVEPAGPIPRGPLPRKG